MSLLRRFAIPLAIALPLLYGYGMVLLSEAPGILGFEIVGLISYSSTLIVGGILGMIGCFKLTEPGHRIRVLLAGTALVFFSEALRGAAIVVDALLHKGDLGTVSVVMFHAGTVMVLFLGTLLFIGSTAWGEAREILTAYVSKLPWKS